MYLTLLILKYTVIHRILRRFNSAFFYFLYIQKKITNKHIDIVGLYVYNHIKDLKKQEETYMLNIISDYIPHAAGFRM